MATVSFYPAHHITMGEGGAVLTDKPEIKKLHESFRDWGRDCWCEPGKDNTCGKRFDWQLGELPYGYDHKYTYSHIGYNLKATDMQAAVGFRTTAKGCAALSRNAVQILISDEKLQDLAGLFYSPASNTEFRPKLVWISDCCSCRCALHARSTCAISGMAIRSHTRFLFGGNLFVSLHIAMCNTVLQLALE